MPLLPRQQVSRSLVAPRLEKSGEILLGPREIGDDHEAVLTLEILPIDALPINFRSRDPDGQASVEKMAEAFPLFPRLLVEKTAGAFGVRIVGPGKEGLPQCLVFQKHAEGAFVEISAQRRQIGNHEEDGAVPIDRRGRIRRPGGGVRGGHEQGRGEGDRRKRMEGSKDFMVWIGVGLFP